MLGEVISYNAEKAYGFIKVANDKHKYFFHISNLIDKNIKIDLNQKVEFESIYTDKGFVARDIQIIQQIECPICKTLNSETNKNCTNTKCEWDLTYVKVGSFIGLSSEEISKYNEKLQKAKDNYLNVKIKKDFEKNGVYKQNKNESTQLSIQIHELKNLSKDEFESTTDFNYRIKSYDYIRIGKYKLLNYDADNEKYQIKIEIEKRDEQILDYEFDKLSQIKISKEIAKKLKEKSIEYDLFAKLEYSGVKYKINMIKFDGCDIKINESELIKAIKDGIIIVTGLAIIIIGGIFDAGKYIYDSFFSDKSSKS